ncbi:phage holin family protein [Streptomyces sp. ACA25]|uniref:phage holin family protein n=1 Tax=Streptomyces sp. ACA25 TaxID=3022596 RepID=UPI002306EB47|nr:phage holin family protein [Streptomyces sp. ACA25]MDB1086516.1 phage holin family protein [Streptomyces sp. ACA25]
MSAADEGRKLGELVASATSELSALVHDEIALAKAELKQDAQRAGIGAAAGIVALALLLLSLPVFSFALAYWLHNWWNVPLAIAFLIVGGLFVVLAGVLGLAAKVVVGKISKPQRSIDSAKDSMAVLSHVKPHPRRTAAPEAQARSVSDSAV